MIPTRIWSQDTVFSWLSKTGFNYEKLGLVLVIVDEAGSKPNSRVWLKYRNVGK